LQPLALDRCKVAEDARLVWPEVELRPGFERRTWAVLNVLSVKLAEELVAVLRTLDPRSDSNNRKAVFLRHRLLLVEDRVERLR
jgi:hypothetical protein